MGRSIGKKMKMKQTLFLILVVALITAQAAPAPIDLLSAFLPRPNRQSIKQHGRNKFAVGAALGAVGLISGNKGITDAGFGLAKAGLATYLSLMLFHNKIMAGANKELLTSFQKYMFRHF